LSTPQHVGHIVHYALDGSPCRAAVISEVPDHPDEIPDGYVLSVGLMVLSPTEGVVSIPDVLNGSDTADGTWHWIEGCTR
jgi:hypothetical protein